MPELLFLEICGHVLDGVEHGWGAVWGARTRSADGNAKLQEWFNYG